MELKLGRMMGHSSADMLLIAPYGIEIEEGGFKRRRKPLLIAPYGIEMCDKCGEVFFYDPLLIAPYGIEISEGRGF